MNFAFPSFSFSGPRFPTAELPLTAPPSMPSFDDDESDDVDLDGNADLDADETDGDDDPYESGNGPGD